MGALSFKAPQSLTLEEPDTSFLSSAVTFDPHVPERDKVLHSSFSKVEWVCSVYSESLIPPK